MRTNKLATASLFFIVFIILVAIFAPVFAPYDPYAQNTENRLMPPSFEHWLGTDELGRDVLSRIIYGARISLIIGLVPTSLSMMLGILLGLMAGYLGKWVDNIIMRFADIMLAFPSLLLAMVVTYTPVSYTHLSLRKVARGITLWSQLSSGGIAGNQNRRKKMKKTISIVFALLLVAMLFVSCSGGGDEGQEGEAPSQIVGPGESLSLIHI